MSLAGGNAGDNDSQIVGIFVLAGCACAAVVLSGFVSLALLGAAWFRNHERPRVPDLALMLFALAVCLPQFWFGVFNFGWSGNDNLPVQLYGSGLVISAILVHIFMLLIVPLMVFAYSEFEQKGRTISNLFMILALLTVALSIALYIVSDME